MVELLMEVAEILLGGEDDIRCETLDIRMSKKRCIERQEAGRTGCRGCEQGKAVREEVENVRGEEGEKMNYESTRLRRGFGGQAKGQKHEMGEKEMEHTVNERGMVVEDWEKTLICRACGEDKPLKEMVPNKRCRDGREKICKKCRGDQNKESYRARKKQDKSDVKGKVKRRKEQDKLDESAIKTVDESATKTADKPFIFILSGLMAENPEIRERLITTAKEHFRSPEGQAMRYIKRGLEFDRMKKIAARKRGEE